MPVAPLLKAENLDVERGTRQLIRGLSLEVAAGEIVHLQGANGAGKTSLLRVLAGLSRYGYSGIVHRDEAPLFLGHQSAVKPALSCRENLRWHPSGEQFIDVQQVDAALEAVGLYGFEDELAGNLSAGQQRRVNLARLYLSRRKLWLLDEPFTAIDARGVHKLQRRFEEHAASGGAVLLSSHQRLESTVTIRTLDLGAGLVGA